MDRAANDYPLPSPVASRRPPREIVIMDFDVQVAHTIEEIGQEAWDHLDKDRPFASYRWHHFSEKVLADNTPIYIVLS